MSELGFTKIAFLLSDNARARMLTALMDNQLRPATELADIAGVTSQTASSHLAKLLDGKLIKVEKQGRHRYYQLSGSHVAQILEYLATLQDEVIVKKKTLTPSGRKLQYCRSCYDHLAGQVGVAITNRLLELGILIFEQNKTYTITSSGAKWFNDLGIDIERCRETKKGQAYACLDWTERVYHLAGPLGLLLMQYMLQQDWLQREQDSRALIVTKKGCRNLSTYLGINKISS